jgi:hypothetical protein
MRGTLLRSVGALVALCNATAKIRIQGFGSKTNGDFSMFNLSAISRPACAGVLIFLVSFFTFGTATAMPIDIVSFDFENATPGDSVANASANDPIISGAVFGAFHSNNESAVLATNGNTNNVYRSGSLQPSVSGGHYNYMSFTTSEQLTLDLLDFAGGQNDIPAGPRSFDILLSTIDAGTPTGTRDGLTGYTSIATFDVANGFANSGANLSIDLSSVTLGIGTYHMVFASSSPSDIVTQTTQLFMDDITLSAQAVPVPAAAWLFGSALAGLGWMRRRTA